MRSCLTTLALLLVAAGLAAWFIPPIVAGYIVEGALSSAGFTATSTAIAVQADPPPLLLLGHADTVTITAVAADVRGLHIDRLDVSLADVDLVGRSFASIEGTLYAVRVEQPDGLGFVASEVDIRGPSEAAATTLRIGAADVRSMVAAAYAAGARGAPPIVVDLAPPAGLVLLVGGLHEQAILTVGSDGSLIMQLGGVAITLARPAPGLPLRLRSLSVSPDMLLINGLIDARRLVP